jgi:mRNA interferase RelE/StbE
VKSGKLKQQLLEVIAQVEASKHLSELEHLKKLRGAENYYRIRIGDFRLGLKFENNVVIVIRFMDRKDIYRYFL